MLSLEGVIPTLSPQGVGKGAGPNGKADKPKWQGHSVGEKGGTGALANMVTSSFLVSLYRTWCLGAAKRFDWVLSNALPWSNLAGKEAVQLVRDLVSGCNPAFRLGVV